MSDESDKAPEPPAERRWMIFSFVLGCGLVTGVFNALTIMRRLDVGWTLSHPWSSVPLITLPLMMIALAIVFVSRGLIRIILAGVGLTLGLTVVVCGILGLFGL